MAAPPTTVQPSCPDAIETLKQVLRLTDEQVELLKNYISQQQSKHIDEFHGQSFDYIVTVCDRVRESCPTFPGDPERVHWSFPDPAAVEGPEKERYHAFEQVAFQLVTRIRYLLILIEREKGGKA